MSWMRVVALRKRRGRIVCPFMIADNCWKVDGGDEAGRVESGGVR